MRLQKLATILIIFLLTLNPINAFAQDGFVDDSVRDMTIVLGSGLAGAVLGLSTLSFVDTPSDHTKNISVGAAIGVVIGVAVAVVGQVSRSSLSYNSTPLNDYNFDSIKRQEFVSNKITNSYSRPTDVSYSFSF